MHPFFLIAPRGFEPLNENPQLTNNKRVTKNPNLVLATGLDKILQKDPELASVIKAWSELGEHIKAAIKALVQSHIQGVQK